VRNLATQLRLRLGAYDRALRADSKLKHDLANEHSDGMIGFERFVLAPLRALASADEPKSTEIIVVDSLDDLDDESLDVGGDHRDATVAGVIALAVSYSSLPQWLRIIASSWPERAAIAPLSGMPTERLDALTELNREDVFARARARLAQELARRTPRMQLGADELDEHTLKLADASGGNLMYATTALKQLGDNKILLDEMDALPHGLEQFFAASFARRTDRSRPAGSAAAPRGACCRMRAAQPSRAQRRALRRAPIV
jgi:hypothetical protein